MTLSLPTRLDDVNYREWETYAPFFEELQNRPITPETQRAWLEEWSQLTKLLREAQAYTYIQKTLDTRNTDRERAFLDMVENVQPNAKRAEQQLKERLLQLDIGDDDMQIMLRNLRSEVDLFNEDNIGLETELVKLAAKYDKLAGGLAGEWDDETQNLNQLAVHLDSSDRATREKAWHTVMQLWQTKRDEMNAIYAEMVEKRAQQATNAGLEDHRAYAFRTRRRFSYSPKECFEFHDAIEKAFVPATQRIMERKRQALGYDRLLPWDWVPEMGKVVSAEKHPPLIPFETEDELIAGSQRVFSKLDGEIGRYFAAMADNGLLDLMTRQGKAMGAYCYGLPLRQTPFIFMNSVGSARNIRTMLHEAGHAFHGFEAMQTQPLVWMQRAPMEFNEVASMAMELLASPYLTKDQGGFFAEDEVGRYRTQHLESIILFMPFMAVVDSFQHWVYTHADQAKDSASLDAKWDELWQRYLPGIDWTGFEDIRASGWQRKLHIFRYPFYYIEYGMAQIGALQVWRNSLNDHPKALADYRRALSLGGTKALPQLFEAAGAQFRFDAPFIGELVDLIEQTIAENN